MAEVFIKMTKDRAERLLAVLTRRMARKVAELQARPYYPRPGRFDHNLVAAAETAEMIKALDRALGTRTSMAPIDAAILIAQERGLDWPGERQDG